MDLLEEQHIMQEEEIKNDPTKDAIRNRQDSLPGQSSAYSENFEVEESPSLAEILSKPGTTSEDGEA